MAEFVECSVDWCDYPAEFAGYCGAHYARQRKGMDMDKPIRKSQRRYGSEFWHGSLGGYTNHKCRCEACKEAYSKSASNYHRKTYGKREVPERSHGTRSGYQYYSCRCVLCVEANRWFWIFNKYGLTEARYREILVEQGGGCALCGSFTESTGQRGMHVDHDHATGKVRGILCSGCNTALGKLGDNVAGVWRALDYLLRSEEQS